MIFYLNHPRSISPWQPHNHLSGGLNYASLFARPKSLKKKVSSKIIALFTLKYEFIDTFYDIGKNSEVGGRHEECIFTFQEHIFNCVTVAKPRVGKFIDRLP